MILPLYKPVGASTHQLSATAGQLYHQKATHTGTLDPMADGVVVVLTDQDRFKKADLSNWPKIYHYQILIGFSTDSHDLLGLITDHRQANLPSVAAIGQKITALLPKYVGTLNQQLPDFSAKRIGGTSYMIQAKAGQVLPPVNQEITIFAHKLLQAELISSAKITTHINQTITQVTGDFRQNQILRQWQQQIFTDLPLITLTATTSKRTYIRALVRDLASDLGLPATTFRLTRTQNGPYSIADCLCLPRAGII